MTIAFAVDDDGGTKVLRGDRASGVFPGVDAALQATHLLLASTEGLLVADLGSPGVSVVATDGAADAACADVRLESVSVGVFPLPARTLADLRLLAALLAVARRQGAARIPSERLRSAVERAAESFDFGRPPWREQAVRAVALAADVPEAGRCWQARSLAGASMLPAAFP